MEDDINKQNSGYNVEDTLVDAGGQDDVLTITAEAQLSNPVSLFNNIFCRRFFYVFISSPVINASTSSKVIDFPEKLVILDYDAFLALSNFDYFFKASLSCYSIEKAIKLILRLLMQRQAKKVEIYGSTVVVKLFNALSNSTTPALIVNSPELQIS